MLAQQVVRSSVGSLLPAYITAGSGLLFGLVALVRSNIVAKKKADRSAVMDYRDLVEDLRKEVGRLGRKFDECEQERARIGEELHQHMRAHP